MEFLVAAFLSGLLGGLLAHYGRELYTSYRVARLKPEEAIRPKESRILKAFTYSEKKRRRPKVNDDQKAWLAENGR